MKPKTAPLKRGTIFAIATGLLFGPFGCGSPPSVVPVLRMVGDALEQEAIRTQSVDAARDERFLKAARRDLDRAYRADLEQAAALTPEWIDSATTVYVAAREQLLRHELERAAERAARAENLRTAAHAQSRAIAILEQQDHLMQRLGLDLWRWTPPTPEIRP